MIISITPLVGTVLNIICICFIHLVGSWICLKIPRGWFKISNSLFRALWWEENGTIYRLIKVKKWKEYLPDGAKLFNSGFQKKRLKEMNEDYYYDFLLETKRAETTHYVSLLPLLFFFIWNPIEAYVLILFYGLIANVPCIIVQRYNRIRFNKVVKKINQRKKGGILHSSSNNSNEINY